MATKKYGDKEIRELLDEFRDHKWVVILPPPGHYAKVRCPCGMHQRQIHKSPSGARYILDVRKWAQRQSCWK